MVSGTDGRMIERLATSFASLRELTWTRLSRISARTRWSLIDQVLISGVNVLTGILLVRTLGLVEFGVYSFMIIGMSLMTGVQVGVTGPMMSLFDRRGSISQGSYLAAVILHQGTFCCVLVLIVFLTPIGFPQIRSLVPVDLGLVALAIVTTQFQDLSRRFFYVTERPARAFLGDLVAYGARLAIVALLALEGTLTVDRVWIVMAVTSAAALLLLWPDLAFRSASWAEIREVTRRHVNLAGWLAGNIVTSWPAEASFILLIVGTVVGPAQLGAARAMQNLVNVANLLIQALENFVPSAATKSLLGGGTQAMSRYVRRMAVAGACAILLMTAMLVSFADPILWAVYGRTFEDAVPIIALLGGCVALAHVSSVMVAGLRALERMQSAFLAQAFVGAISLAAAVPLAVQWGVVGALTGLLLVRILLTGVLTLLLSLHVQHADGVG